MIDNAICGEHRWAMTSNDIWHRRSIRLQDFDYSQAGAYYITICTQDKLCRFGVVEDAQMIVNEFGVCAQRCWQLLPEHFPKLILDEFTVMPNHIHGVIFLADIALTATPPVQSHAATVEPPGAGRARVIPGSLGAIVRSYKSAVTGLIHRIPSGAGIQLWQRNYYEHIIRDEADLFTKRQYIRNNPLEWELDEFYVRQVHPSVGAQHVAPSADEVRSVRLSRCVRSSEFALTACRDLTTGL